MDFLSIALGAHSVATTVDGKLPFAVEGDCLLCLGGGAENEEKKQEDIGHGYFRAYQ